MLKSVSTSCAGTDCLYRGLEACGWQKNIRDQLRVILDQRWVVHPYHLISGTWACTLEAWKLSPVVNGDDQFPDSQQYHSHQEDTAHHCEQDHEDICPSATLWKDKSPGCYTNNQNLKSTLQKLKSCSGKCESYCRLSIGQICPHLCLSSQIKHAAANTCTLKAGGGVNGFPLKTQTQGGCASLISKELEFSSNIHPGTLFWWEKPIQNDEPSPMEEHVKRDGSCQPGSLRAVRMDLPLVCSEYVNFITQLLSVL